MYSFAAGCVRLFVNIFYRNKVCWEFDPKALSGAAIIAPIHASYLDPPVVAGSWHGELHFFAGGHLFKNRVLRWILPRVNTHPVVKGQELIALRSALELLEQGKRVVLFPEGTRSPDGQIQQLQRGVAFLAIQARAPIIPCFLTGTYDAWPRNRSWPHLFGRRTSCIFGRPIYPFEKNGKPIGKAQLTETIQAELARLSRL